MFGTEFNYLKPSAEEARKIIHPSTLISFNFIIKKL